MISSGMMILILMIFMVAIGVAFCSGFFVGKNTLKKEKPEVKEAVYEEPKQSFFEKIIELIDDRLNRKREEQSNDGEVKTIVTSDGIAKNENTFYG
jgi:hypothetical protein